VALSEKTNGMIGKRELGLMKQGALLVNVCRGGVVQQDALVEALQAGRLGGAGLDVFEKEPVPADSPLLACEQIVLTPHVADMTPEGLDLLNHGAVENVLAFLDGKPQNVVSG
jgi:phosphoglycerate dehydrogenase-like enzyme